MSKNLIPIVAKELGVEIGEVFTVSVVPEVIYRFTETRLECGPVNSEFQWELSTLSFNHLITTEIIKLPFEPKLGDGYWTYNCNWKVSWRVWNNDFLDYVRNAKNCVFRTQEEAERARPQLYKELTGKDWEDDVD